MIHRSSTWSRLFTRAVSLAILLSFLLPAQGLSWANGQPTRRVIGQPNFESRGFGTAYSMSNPQDVALDPVSGKLFVIDHSLSRILRFTNPAGLANGSPAEMVFGQADFRSVDSAATASTLNGPSGLTVDTDGRLWVADTYNNRVLRFDNAASRINGASADGVLGQADFTSKAAALTQSGMNNPTDVAVNDAGTLWVVDTNNYRVLRFANGASKPNGAGADGVLGQADFTHQSFGISQNGMYGPGSLALDAGVLWVADTYNNRVLRFDGAAGKADGADADGVLGQSDFTSSTPDTGQAKFDNPRGLAVDGSGRLWVADINNNRVLRFDNAASRTNGASADGLLGQDDFTTKVSTNGQDGMYQPSGLATGAGGRLWVADTQNSRVLRFDTPLAASTPGSGHFANGMLGQFDFGISGFLSAADTLRMPFSVAIDPVSGKIFVADTFSGRVLRFANPKDLANGEPAEAVLGQPDMTQVTPVPSRSGLSTPMGLTVDPAGRLWVADTTFNRVLRYDNAATKPDGADADGLLGQANYTSIAPAADAKGLNQPSGVAADGAGRLWVFDSGNNRVLRFDNAAGKPNNGASADGVLGQPDFVTTAALLDQSHLENPKNGTVDAQGRLWVSDAIHNRVLRFDNAAAKPDGAGADGVLGQPDFVTADSDISQHNILYPGGIAVDSTGRLWVASSSAFRVLRFDGAAAKPNGADADAVLGQPDYTSPSLTDATQSGLVFPVGLALQGDNRLWVADTGHNRVLLFSGTQAVITRNGPTPTYARIVGFTVKFNYPVSGLSASNLALSASGSLFGATITGVSHMGSGASDTWNVTASTAGLAGDLRLEMVNSTGVLDEYANPVDGLPTSGSPAYTLIPYKTYLPKLVKP